jgi:hypothetical protein
MGTVLIVLLFVFPGGIVGTLAGALSRLRARSKAQPAPGMVNRNA